MTRSDIGGATDPNLRYLLTPEKVSSSVVNIYTEFREHLCHPGGEGPDTYTGCVGLKPVEGKAVLWVKNFPTTLDEVPRAAYEFAKKFQEMTGLPVVPVGDFKGETH